MVSFSCIRFYSEPADDLIKASDSPLTEKINGEAHKKQYCLTSFVQIGGSNLCLHNIAPEVTKTPSDALYLSGHTPGL